MWKAMSNLLSFNRKKTELRFWWSLTIILLSINNWGGFWTIIYIKELGSIFNCFSQTDVFRRKNFEIELKFGYKQIFEEIQLNTT